MIALAQNRFADRRAGHTKFLAMPSSFSYSLSSISITTMASSST